MTSDRSHPGRDAQADDALVHDRLAQAARAAHEASLSRLSPRVQAQLAQRRRAALAQDGRPAPVRLWPMMALGSAAALTLAVGLFVLHVGDDAGMPQAPDTAVAAQTPDTGPAPQAATETLPDTATAPLAANDEPPPELLAAEFDSADEALGFDAQDESPDFYLWLGSQDAQADVTESL